ncbi:MAG: hypothetical protein ABI564_17640, partial [Ideonella sp.]
QRELGKDFRSFADGLRAVYVEVSRGSEAGQYPDIGTHRAVLDSSVGRALFVGMSKQDRASVLNQLCLNEPGRAEELRQSARDALSDYERYGVCMTADLVIPGWSALAIPLKGLSGRKLALSLGLPTGSVPTGQMLPVAGAALTAAEARIALAFKALSD